MFFYTNYRAIMEFISVLAWLTVVLSLVAGEPPAVCTQCQQSQVCNPPECFCCRDDLKIPNIDVSQIPQMVFFTFDDAVTTQVAGFYQELFDSARKNPNGCPISMTLFISHYNTDYRLVSEFYRKGMEIASHSVTHNHMNGSNFLEEAKAQKENLAKLANIPIDEITGWRSPFLKPAGDLQPDALKKLGYKYDATLTFSKRSLNERPPGPFTLDFGFPYECQVKPCPKHKHPGFWEIPVVSLMDYKHKYDCVYVDGCMNAPPDEGSAYKFLWDNFNNYYTTTRMPFGINMHPSWFFYPDRLRAMDRFIKKLVSMNDVYIVSANRVLQWLKYPTPLSELHSFVPWACDGREKKFSPGPRVVRTNLPPPPTLMSWMPSRARGAPRHMFSARTMRPNNMFTPAPVFTPRHFTQNNRDTFRSRVTPSRTISPRFSPRREGSRSDISRDLELQQMRIREEILKRQLRQWQIQRRRKNAMKFPSPNKNANVAKPSVPQTNSNNNKDNTGKNRMDHAPPVKKVLSQAEIMEQHEQRLRQHQMLEERQRRLEIERLKNEQKKTTTPGKPIIPTKPKIEVPVQKFKPDVVVGPVKPFQPKQKHVLWHPNIRPTLKPAEARQRGPVKIQQETIKLWPTMVPTLKPTIRPSVRPVMSRAVKRFNDRRVVTRRTNNELSRLRNRLNRPTGFVKPTANPSVRPFPYSEAPVWYDTFGNRLNAFNNHNNFFRRGGSNRRSGMMESNSIPIRTGSFRRTHISPGMHVANESQTMEQFSDMRQNQLIPNSVPQDFFGRTHQRPIPMHENSLSRGRNMLPRRNSISPSVAQRMAWNNFIRQMFGPH